jgi:hypothetical protein
MLSLPMLAELQTNIDAMRTALFRAVRLTAAIAVPTSAGIALVADEMVSLLLGPKWLLSVPLVWLLCVFEGSLSQVWNEIRPILAGTVAMAAVVLLLHQFAFAERTEPALIELVIELILLSPSGAATYLIVLWAIGSPVMGEAAELSAGSCAARRRELTNLAMIRAGENISSGLFPSVK